MTARPRSDAVTPDTRGAFRDPIPMQAMAASSAGSPYGSDDARWQAVLKRDANARGYFVYAVHTTGTYDHPGSHSRLPKRCNVEFFDTAEAAEAAGYRASRRPQQSQADRAALVAQACRRIENAVTPPSLDELAAQAGLSPHHFHRIFRAELGLTPKGYAAAHRARKLREQLGAAGKGATGKGAASKGTAGAVIAGNGSTGNGSAGKSAAGHRAAIKPITDAIYEAGFNSSSRFYEQSGRLLGMRASDYRAGGAGAEIRFAVGQCSLGAILVAQSARGICAILLGDDPDQLVRDLQDQFPKAELIGGNPEFERLVAQVVGFVEAPEIGLDLPLDVRGTSFQQRVWQALRDIPPGTTVTYTDIAQRIGAPKAVRAVGHACGSNCLAVAIPCHRVVRRDGDLAGYRWGVERKRELLRREKETEAKSDA